MHSRAPHVFALLAGLWLCPAMPGHAEALTPEQRRDAYRAAEHRAAADLTPFASRAVATTRPSTAGPVRTGLARQGPRYIFICQGQDESIRFSLDPREGPLGDLRVAVGWRLLEPRPFTGGPVLLLANREWPHDAKGVKSELLSADVAAPTLTCRYRYTVAGAPGAATLTAEFSALGKSLVLKVRGSAGFSGFRFAHVPGTPIPAAWDDTVSRPRRHPRGAYAVAMADIWQSDATRVLREPTRTLYAPLTDGTRRALRDTFYLTVSSRYEETLLNVPHRPSPFLGDMAERVVFDIWSGTFAEVRARMERLALHGVRSGLVIKHGWQRGGFDRYYPNILPSNPALGGDAGLRALSLSLRDMGHRFAVHENIYCISPIAEDFREELCARGSDGRLLPGYRHGSNRLWWLKPSLLESFGRRYSSEIRRRYACSAAFIDVMPRTLIDYDAAAPGNGMVRRSHEWAAKLWSASREIFQGPVLTEHTSCFAAGQYDGGTNRGMMPNRQRLTVAVELLKVHPKMSNVGMGYYERWLPDAHQPGWRSYVMTDRELDYYRALEVAFGRTGFVGRQLMQSDNVHSVVREHYLMQAFARAYTGRELRRLAYFVEDAGWAGWIDAAAAARWGQCDRMVAVYEDGQTVWVNVSPNPWTVAGRELPQYGTFTRGPRAVAYTALVDGQIVDYAAYDSVTYADARSHQWTPTFPAPVQPTLRSWKDRGDGSVALTLEWRTERPLDRDFKVFLHVIRYEGDHFKLCAQCQYPPRPATTQWPKGKPVLDGPHRVAAPVGETRTDYDLVAGLYDGQGRIVLMGNATEVRVARLHVQRAGGKIAALRLERESPFVGPYAAPSVASYREGGNRERAVIDFGKVATDGAVAVTHRPDGREIVPVPIGQSVRVGLAGPIAKATPMDEQRRPGPELATETREGKTWFTIPAGAAKVVAK